MVMTQPRAASPIMVDDFLFNTSGVRYLQAYNPFLSPYSNYVYRSRYSRLVNNAQETWFDTVQRIINGVYTIQKRHFAQTNLRWDSAQKQAEAERMFDLIYRFQFTPPGRGLSQMGAAAAMDRNLMSAVTNCCAVDTGRQEQGAEYAYMFCMDQLMLGVGVGFTVGGAGTKVQKPEGSTLTFVVPDSREGWCESLGLLLRSFFHGTQPVAFDYSLVRPAGAPIKTFGGIASGPEPLIDMHECIRSIMSAAAMRGYMSITDVVDIMNLIGRCVVCGGVRRSAMIALGSETEEFIRLKDRSINAARMDHHGWASNNSIMGVVGQDYKRIAKLAAENGEPGVIWLDNARQYGRTGEFKADNGIVCFNPCAEIGLEHMELCNLSELYPFNIQSTGDWLDALKYAHIYARTVTLMSSPWPEQRSVVQRNRRIGIGQTGVQVFCAQHGLDTWADWNNLGYKFLQRRDRELSAEWKVPQAIKLTCIKPAGTTSQLVNNCTPGVHYAVADNPYIRRVRDHRFSPHWRAFADAGYPVEVCAYADDTMVVEFPMDAGVVVKTEAEASLEDQLQTLEVANKTWVDNATSMTLKVDHGDTESVVYALRRLETTAKAISFLPRTNALFQQMPYEGITREEYNARKAAIREVDWSYLAQGKGDRYCDGDSCTL
jgi:ribonucleoside-triphosphate reductase